MFSLEWSLQDIRARLSKRKKDLLYVLLSVIRFKASACLYRDSRVFFFSHYVFLDTNIFISWSCLLQYFLLLELLQKKSFWLF